MLRTSLTGLDRRSLRLWLVVFFAALAVPAGFLVHHAYGQLEWEAFHRHRVLAEELAARIDARLVALIDREEARSFTDYAFLVVEGDRTANVLQRSELAAFPVPAHVPGLVGYFQVDPDGGFSTPLLPRGEALADPLGMPAGEQTARAALEARIARVLRENRLAPAPADHAQVRGASAAGAEREDGTGTADDRTLLDARRAPAPDERPALRKLSQSAFDELSAAPEAQPPRPSAPARSLGRVSELDLDSAYSARLRQQSAEKAKREAPAKAAERKSRKELGALPAPAAPAARDAAGAREQEQAVAQSRAEAVAQLRAEFAVQLRPESVAQPSAESVAQSRAESVAQSRAESTEQPRAESTVLPRARSVLDLRTFESEIDPFEIALLGSGHLVLYRKVFKDGQRYIQGALVEEAAFVRALIESDFRGNSLSRMSDLAVAYGGNVIAAFRGQAEGRQPAGNGVLSGSLLYRTRLSAPFEKLELIASVTRLPTGPGATVLAWLAGTIAVVLCGGIFAIYRLGARQIELSTQQQDFVSAVSHELKTPLTSIRMYGEMLRDGLAPDAKKPAYYEYIFQESERLSRLIANVLQLARMTRNELELELEPMTLHALTDAIRSKVSYQVERAGFELTIGCPDDIEQAVVRVDPDCFSQIAINLVDNALKFSAAATRKTVEIRWQARGARAVALTVRDYGPGVRDDQMRKIFRLFYRSENELTRETVGTGIGLALVRQLAQAMDAGVDVSNRGPGAEFEVVFPRHDV